MGQINLPDNWIDEKRDLQRQIDELRAAVGLSSATISKGGLNLINNAFLSMRDGSGNLVVYIGPDASGNQIFQVWRPGGQAIMATQHDVASGRYFFNIRDFLGHQIFADDVQTGGLARPWLSVPMYALFSMPASSVYTYMNALVSSVTSETTLWQAHIPLVTHPRIVVDGIWGQASGSNTATYKLYANGSTLLGSWSTTGVEQTSHMFDVSALIDASNVPLDLKVIASGTGSVGAQVQSCYLRQT